MAQESVKRVKIVRSVNRMVTAASIAVFVLIFCLTASHALLNKLSFQNKLIDDQSTARNTLQEDITAVAKLTNSYETFNEAPTNLLGGAVSSKDNDNAKIVLDALPSVYDYPALTSSLQYLLSNQGLNVDSIGGTDESATINSTSAPNQPVAMPFTFSVDGPYQNVQNVINTFEKSIRPFQFQTIDISGDQSDVTLSVTAQTYFQPTKKFAITMETVQ